MRAGLLLLVACASAAPAPVAPPVADRGVTIPSDRLAEAIHARWLGDPARAAQLVANAGDVAGLAELGRAELARGHVAAADAAFARAVAGAERGKRGTWQWPAFSPRHIVTGDFTPDGRWIVTADGEGRVDVYDAGSLRVVRSLQTVGFPRLFAISPNGRWLVAGQYAMRVWDLETGAVVADHASNGAIAFTPASTLLVARPEGGFVELDVATQREVGAADGPKLSHLAAHGDRIYGVDNTRVITFDAQRTELAIKSFPRAIEALRAVDDGFVVATVDALVAHGIETSGRYTTVAAHGSRVAATGGDGIVDVFEDGKRVRTLATARHHGVLAFHPRGTLLVTAGFDGASLWDASTGKRLAMFARPPAAARSLAFDARGDRLAVGSTAGHAAIWTLATGAVSTITVRPGTLVDAVAFGPDGALATATTDLNAPGPAQSSVAVFDTDGTRRWARELDRIRFLGYRPNTSTLTTAHPIEQDGSTATTAMMWAPNGTLDRTLALVTSHGFHWTHDGRAFAGATDKQLVTTALDGTTTRIDLVHAQSALHPSGKILAAALDGGTVAIWDLVAKTPTRVMFDDNGELAGLAWTPDGRLLVTASHDTVSLWDPSTGDRLGAFAGPAPIRALAIHPDGRVIATGHDDGRVLLTSIATGELVATLHVPGELAAFVTTPDGAIDGTLPDDILAWSAGPHVLSARGAFARQRVPGLLAQRLAQLPAATSPRHARRVPPPGPPACYTAVEHGRRALHAPSIQGNTLRFCLETSYDVRKRVSLRPPLMCFAVDLASGKYTPHAPSPREALGAETPRITAEHDGAAARVCKDGGCRDVTIRKGDPARIGVVVDAAAKLLAATYRIADDRAAVLVYDVASGKRISQFIAQGENLAYEFLDETLLVTSTPCAGPCSSSMLFDARNGRAIASVPVNTSALSAVKADGDVWAFNDWDSTTIVLQNVKTGRVTGRFNLPKRACTNEPDSEWVSCEGNTLLAAGSKLVVLPAMRPGDAMIVDQQGKLLAEHALPICQ